METSTKICIFTGILSVICLVLIYCLSLPNYYEYETSNRGVPTTYSNDAETYLGNGGSDKLVSDTGSVECPVLGE